MTGQAFCIHGHFYQPPREDPLTGIVPQEPGATPYKNWNERIHAECYRPNAEAGNFERISFNIGPTLSRWMAAHDPLSQQRIVEQDRANVQRFGVGNAISQAYNHTILPLATLEDKVTQVAWGIADFEQRFGRKPQGMWLPETAVDLETLTVLADFGIEFTTLAPWQADTDLLDPTEPYRVVLPGGRSIIVFFYHAGLSTQVSFDAAATSNADRFAAHNIRPQYSLSKLQQGEPQLLLIASDGELYGHHKPFRDMFLTHLLNGASTQSGITPTFPALWLRQHPPRRTIAIRERTSWSCHHGVTRWMDHCSCTPGDVLWKGPLRRAFDQLASAIDEVYTNSVRPLVDDPIVLRNRYIEVILGRRCIEDLLSELCGRHPEPYDLQRIDLLLRAQHQRQQMFTSCGWFFDNLNGIEPKNNLAYAAYAVHLTYLATGIDLTSSILAALRQVKSANTGLRADRLFMQRLQAIRGGNDAITRHQRSDTHSRKRRCG